MAATEELLREPAAWPRNVDGPASPALVLATSLRSPGPMRRQTRSGYPETSPAAPALARNRHARDARSGRPTTFLIRTQMVSPPNLGSIRRGLRRSHQSNYLRDRGEGARPGNRVP